MRRFRDMLRPGLVILLSLCGAHLLAGEVGKLYWTDQNKILRADLPGANVEELVVGAPAFGLAIDLVNGCLYWTRFSAIERSFLDGSGREAILEEIHPRHGIALDPDGGKLYWTDGGEIDDFTDDAIVRSDLDGTNAETVISGLDFPEGLALDVPGGKIYWTETQQVRRANLDGSDVELLVTLPDLSLPKQLAIDLENEKIYWVDFFEIRRANLDGSNVEVILFTPAISLTLDPSGGKIYWTVPPPNEPPFLGAIRRANLDGSDSLVLPLDAQAPRGIAVDPLGEGRDPMAVPATGRVGAVLLVLLIGTSGSVVAARRRRRHRHPTARRLPRGSE